MASTEFVVTSTRLYRIVDGKRVRHFRGEVISGLSKEDVERFKAAGAIAAKSSDEAKVAQGQPASAHPAEVSAVPDPETQPDPPASAVLAARNSGDSGVSRPAKTATVDVWRQYAVDSGQLTAEATKGKTRDELRDTLK